MKRVLDHNPQTGLTEIFHHNEATDTTTIEVVQDVSLAMDMAQALRNHDSYSKEGIKQDWWHLAHIPDSIILKMKFEDGVDVYDRNDWPAVGRLLNDKYSKFKTTSGKHKFKS